MKRYSEYWKWTVSVDGSEVQAILGVLSVFIASIGLASVWADLVFGDVLVWSAWFKSFFVFPAPLYAFHVWLFHRWTKN